MNLMKPILVEMTRGQELFAATTLPWEIGNAVSAMLKRRRTTVEMGLALLAQYRQISIRLIEARLDDSLALASRLNIYAYDAYVIQCARQTGQPILSLDSGLCAAARLVGVEILEVKQ